MARICLQYTACDKVKRFENTWYGTMTVLSKKMPRYRYKFERVPTVPIQQKYRVAIVLSTVLVLQRVEFNQCRLYRSLSSLDMRLRE